MDSLVGDIDLLLLDLLFSGIFIYLFCFVSFI